MSGAANSRKTGKIGEGPAAERAPVSGHLGATGEPPREQIERHAYELYLARGTADGQDIEDWLHAERELREANTKVRADPVLQQTRTPEG